MTVNKPDLYIKSFTATAPDRNVGYKVEVCNKGSSALTTFRLGLYYHLTAAPACKAAYSSYTNISGLAAGACTTRNFTRYSSPTGTFTPLAFVDQQCAVTEGDEVNNTATTTVTVKKPDLYIKSFTATAPDRNVGYKVEVCNKGSSVLTTFRLGLYYHLTAAPACKAAYSSYTNISGLAAGACTTRNFTRYSSPTGTFTPLAFVDQQCAVTEGDEVNNTATTTVTVKKPDLYIKSFTATAPDRNVGYKVEVCNKGSSVLTTFKLALFYNSAAAPGCGDKYSSYTNISGLAAGACTTRSFTRYSSPTGNHTGWVMADSDCAIVEGDENNNTASSAYEVKKPDFKIKSFKATVSGTTTSYSVQLCNDGTTGLTSFKLGLYYNQAAAPACKAKYSSYFNVSGLGAGQCTTRNFTRYNTPAGTAVAWAFADSDCAVAEALETNNTASTVVSQGVDLDVDSITWAHTATDVTFTVKLCNNGGPVSVGHTLALFYNRQTAPTCKDKPDQSKTLAAMAKAACASETFKSPLPKPGAYKVWALADATCALQETDETNNTGSLLYTILATIKDMGTDAMDGGADGGDAGDGGADADMGIVGDVHLVQPDRAAAPDLAPDQAAADLPGPSSDSGGGWHDEGDGCDCSAAPGEGPAALLPMLLLLCAWVALARRRRR